MAIVAARAPHKYKHVLLLYLYLQHKRYSTARYLNRGRHWNERRTRTIEVDGLRMLDLPAPDFFREFRVTQETFLQILVRLENDPVFLKDSPGRPQTLPIVQLAVALWRMTHEGNGASVSVIARTFGCAGQF